MTNIVANENENEKDNEFYTLTPWACLLLTLRDYGIDVGQVSGKVGAHIVEDFMELMIKQGNIQVEKGD